MAHFVSALVAVARDHALLAYALAFVLAGSESFPVFGAAVPGTATIVALAALVPSGALAFWPLVAATTAGAVAGDGLSYWLGHRYRGRAAAVWPLRRNPGLIDKGKAFFASHGGKAIVIARFTPGVRAVVPVVAGILGMTGPRFYAVNILSAVLWAPAHVAIGLAIGASLAVLGAIAGRLVALALGLLVIGWLVVWGTPRLVRWLTSLAEPAEARLRQWAERGNSWPQRQLRPVFEPGQVEIRGLALLGLLLVASFWLLIGVVQDALAGDPLMRADRAALHLFQAVRVEWADRLAGAISTLGGVPVTIAVGAAMLAWFAWQRAWRAAFYELAALAGAAVLSALLLLLPPPALTPFQAGALPPAWEMALAVALYGFLAVAVAHEGSARLGIAVSVAVALLLVLFGLARLYLGLEWLSMVILASAFGVAWVAVLSIGYLSHWHRKVRPVGLLAAASLAFLASGAITLGVASAAVAPPPPVPRQVMPLRDWRDGGWQSLAARRVDLFGERKEVLNLQWAGGLRPLEAALAAHGWRPAAPWTWLSAAEWLSPGAGPAQLPVLPHLDNGRPEALAMIRTGKPLGRRERAVLRVWPAEVRLTQAGRALPLWVGAATIERIKPVSFLFTGEVTEKRPGRALALLHEALPGAALVRRQALAVLLGEAPSAHARLSRRAGAR